MSPDPRAASEARPQALALAERIVEEGGGQVRAVLLYGSRLLRAEPDRYSAFDLVVIVEAYRPFYRAYKSFGKMHRPAWLMNLMAHILPPNTIAFVPGGSGGVIAKCLIISSKDFEQGLGHRPRDHFLLGRMVQRVGVVWAVSSEESSWVKSQLLSARTHVLSWMAPYLKGPVDAKGFGRRLLEVCYQGEVRPEAKDRFERIFDAQVDHFTDVFNPVLEGGIESGLLVREGGLYRLASPVAASEKRRLKSYFMRSKARATLRWFKHMLTFANWLPYIVSKVERHSGKEIQLTTLEKKLPIVFLWPRAIQVLFTRREKGVDGEG